MTTFEGAFGIRQMFKDIPKGDCIKTSIRPPHSFQRADLHIQPITLLSNASRWFDDLNSCHFPSALSGGSHKITRGATDIQQMSLTRDEFFHKIQLDVQGAPNVPFLYGKIWIFGGTVGFIVCRVIPCQLRLSGSGIEINQPALSAGDKLKNFSSKSISPCKKWADTI